MTETFESLRPLLFSIAYRMLGSAMDAEDMVQETYLRYQATPPESIQSHRAFLTTIVTRLCLNQLTAARSQRETYIGPWLPEPVLTADEPLRVAPGKRLEAYDSLSMAFLVLLESLTPPERAVFLLHEVFDYSYAEIALVVEKSEVACRQLLSRARKRVRQGRPRFPQVETQHHAYLQRFISVVENGKLDELVSMLAEDATLWADSGGQQRGAALHPVSGGTAIARFIMGTRRFVPEDARMEIREVNGQPAILLIADSRVWLVIVPDFEDQHITALRVIGNPDKLRRL